MATDAAAADSASKPDTDTRTRPEPAAAGPGATSTAPGGTSLGERQIRAKPDAPVIGKADDPAERQADTAADQVMRMPEPPAEQSPASPDVQRVAETGAPEAPPASAELQGYLQASKGGGMPLPAETRAGFEAKYERSFADVRIHDDTAADGAARSIGARAFTHGTDIYFRTGAYDPASEPGKRLLAHELAHVVQQRPGITRAVIRRAKGVKEHDPRGGGTKTQDKNTLGEVNVDAHTLRLAKVRLPSFKIPHHPGTLTWTTSQRSGEHAATWSKVATPILGPVVKQHATEKLHQSEPFRLETGPDFRAKDRKFLVGSADDIASALARLPWGQDNKPREHQIDHKKELQLGGPDNDPTNLWLLDEKVNTSSGSTIRAAIEKDIKALLEEARKNLIRVPSYEEVKTWRDEKKVTFGEAVPDVREGEQPVAVAAGTSPPGWTEADLKTAKMDLLVSMSPKNIAMVTGTEQKVSIFSRRGGGAAPRQVETKTGGALTPLYGPGYQTLDGVYSGKPGDSGEVGSVKVAFREKDAKGKTMLKDGKPLLHVEDQRISIMAMPGVTYGGLLDTAKITTLRDAFHTPVASPISFGSLDFDLDTGLQARGSVPKPTIKLLERVSIDVFVSGDDIGLEASVSGGAMSLPGPFKVEGGAMALRVSVNEGFAVTGQVDFAIGKMAKGFVAGVAGTSGGFALDGELNFDSKLFTKAKLGLQYRDGKWGVDGELGVGPGHVKGIKSASAKVAVSDGTVTAEGEFESSLKGVDKGKVGFRYNEATGMEITGEILLGKGIPGIRSGKLDATVKQVADGWSLAGGVVLEPSVPGLTGTVAGRYEDGAFQVDADLAYERGLAKGVLKLGLTNQAVGPDGRPAGPPKADGSLTAYGGGQVTLAITPWLQGTVGLLLKPNGEIEVTGKVALPPVVDVFTVPPVERTLLSIGLDIPIVGVAVLGQRIGIFATIRGSLIASAGIGPGQLRDLALSVVYNPDRPDDTTVTGTGTFVVPANAGLRLRVDGGLGAGIPVVSATAGVSVFGEVGVAGAASAAATVNWSPRTGIVLDARGELSVEPKFRFGIEAYVDVSADLWLKTIELYHRKWSLASFEYGSNLRFGLIFPLHYESTKPFTLSFDEIQWTYPRIEPRVLLGGLMEQLVGQG